MVGEQDGDIVEGSHVGLIVEGSMVGVIVDGSVDGLSVGNIEGLDVDDVKGLRVVGVIDEGMYDVSVVGNSDRLIVEGEVDEEGKDVGAMEIVVPLDSDNIIIIVTIIKCSCIHLLVILFDIRFIIQYNIETL